METNPYPQTTAVTPKTSGLAIASLVCGILAFCTGVSGLLGIIFGIVALIKINKSQGALKGLGLAIGGLVTSVLFSLIGLGIMASMLLPALARAKGKANRVKCVNNLGGVYKSGLAFAQDNGERLPWQLTASGVRNHFGGNVNASSGYGSQPNPRINEVKSHPDSLEAAGVYGLNAMKMELVTAKILVSPCDPDRMAANESLQENWRSYDTKANGVSAELGNGCSYVLVRGADTMRPSSVYGLTRNWSSDNLNTGNWLGSDSDWGNERTMAGLRASQGQCVTMDGAAMQTTNADFGGFGRRTQQAQVATGGVARGTTSLNLIRGSGL